MKTVVFSINNISNSINDTDIKAFVNIIKQLNKTNPKQSHKDKYIKTYPSAEID